MSLVTRCPACATAFKVVRDQLRLSDGWVRCGRCNHVFDATLEMWEDGEIAPVTPMPVSPPPTAHAAAEPKSGAASEVVGAHAAVPTPPSETESAIPSAVMAPESEHPVEPPVERPPVVALEPDRPGGAAMRESASAPGWPAPHLLDLGPSTPVPDTPAVGETVEPSLSAAASSPGSTLPPDASIEANSPMPRDLPVVVADEPWPAVPQTAAADAPPAAPAPRAPSPVDEAVNAQLQRALRRARIQAVRDARARERGATSAPANAPPPPQRSARAKDSAMPPSSAPKRAAARERDLLPPRTLRQASNDSAAAEPAHPAAAAPAVPSFLDVPAPGGLAIKLEPSTQRKLLFALIGLAIMVLLLQVLRHERVGQELLCRWTGCEVSAPRRLDAIRIDGSAFTPERDGSFRLLFTLRNAAATPLAMPAIELSLLDGNERAVVRRVFRPSEFGAPTMLGARAEQAAALSLTLKAAGGDGTPPVVGYSMLAFYP